jgi:ABC-type antimicrobial peptide transport system permease subunit
VRALPGVEAVSFALYTPFGNGYGINAVRDNGRRYVILTNRTDANYFAVTGLRVLRGRGYTPAEVATQARVVLISQTLAREFWGEADPIGDTMTRVGSGSERIIGIVADAITADLLQANSAALYAPLGRNDAASMDLIARTTSAPDVVRRAIAERVRALGPNVRVTVTLVSDDLDRALEAPRVFAKVSSTLGFLALGLALMGLYGVTTFVAGQRTREIGIRMAVGATVSDVVQLLRPVIAGVAAGLVLGVLAGHALDFLLLGLNGHDPLALIAAVLILLMAGGAAVFIPARRAARIDPARVLREG